MRHLFLAGLLMLGTMSVETSWDADTPGSLLGDPGLGERLSGSSGDALLSPGADAKGPGLWTIEPAGCSSTNSWLLEVAVEIWSSRRRTAAGLAI